jgi:hypothetical protein
VKATENLILILIIILIISIIYISPWYFAYLAFKRGRKGWGIAILVASLFAIGLIVGTIFILLPRLNKIREYILQNNLGKPVKLALVVIGAGLVLMIVLIVDKNYKGGRINKDGNIDAKAFSVYAKVCEVESPSAYDADSTNFIPQATPFELFSEVPPKILVIDTSDGADLYNRGLDKLTGYNDITYGDGLDGDWNPQRLYDVQLVVCIDEEKNMTVYKANTGEFFLASRLSSLSPKLIQEDIAQDIMGQRSMYTVFPR